MPAWTPDAVRQVPGWFTPTEWRWLGVAALGSAGLITWAAFLRRVRNRGIAQEGDRTCGSETYRQVLGAHKTPTHKADRAWQYMPYVRASAQHFGVDPTLLAALVHTESGWNPSAGSKAGAQGLAQFMPNTAIGIFRRLASEGQWPFPELTQNNDPVATTRFRAAGVERFLDRTDPQQSAWLGAKLVRDLMAKHRNVEIALAAYNAGGGRVVGKPRSEWPQETQRYVPGVLRRQSWYQELEQACGRGRLFA